MFRNITGKEGSIKIVELGAVIGQFASWRLYQEKQQGDDDKYTKYFTFRAECEYINPDLFGDDDYHPEVFIVVKRDRRTRKVDQYRLEQAEGRKRSLDGRNLLMEGVTLCRV